MRKTQKKVQHHQHISLGRKVILNIQVDRIESFRASFVKGESEKNGQSKHVGKKANQSRTGQSDKESGINESIIWNHST
jgi:hypothetical protein